MPLRLVTFNVLDLFAPLADAKRASVARMLRRANADVVALQEVGGRAPLEAVLADVADLGYGAPLLGTADARGIGNALVARAPLDEVADHTAQVLDVPPFRRGDPPPYAGLPLKRGVVYARVAGIHLFVCHFKSRRAVPLRTEAGEDVIPATARERGEGELRGVVWRAAEALFVRGLVDRILARDPRAEIAVAGDLNDVAGSTTLRILRGEDLVDCAASVPADARFTVLHGGARDAIDHVLASPALGARVVGARVMNDELGDPGATEPGHALAGSDHAPLVVDFA